MQPFSLILPNVAMLNRQYELSGHLAMSLGRQGLQTKAALFSLQQQLTRCYDSLGDLFIIRKNKILTLIMQHQAPLSRHKDSQNLAAYIPKWMMSISLRGRMARHVLDLRDSPWTLEIDLASLLTSLVWYSLEVANILFSLSMSFAQ
jgi:hypothetical protein